MEKIKYKEKYAASASPSRPVNGKVRCNESNELLLRDKEREVRDRVESRS